MKIKYNPLFKQGFESLNSGFASSGGTFDDLANIPNPTDGSLAYVYESQGTKWLPGTVGGTYYPSGIYVYNEAEGEWVSDRNEIAIQLHETDTVSNVLTLDNTTPFVPDADYEPATKLYVDNIASSGFNITDRISEYLNGYYYQQGIKNSDLFLVRFDNINFTKELADNSVIQYNYSDLWLNKETMNYNTI